MTPSEAMRIDENPKDYTVQERKDAKKVLAKVGSLGQDRTAPKMAKGGKATKKVPVISIGVGMAEMPKGQKKTKMMRGGMANGKEHMYAAGGAVNDGLKALAKVRPDVVAKMMNK
jgi:hypothetical protein